MGWNASNKTGTEKSVPAGSECRRHRWVLSLALLLVVALVAVFFSHRRDSATPEKIKKPSGTGRIAAASTNSAARARAAARASNAVEVVPAKTNDVWLGVEVDHRKFDTNGTLIVETIYTKDGKSHIYYHDTRPKVFEHASDQILALATANAPGGMPPLPSMPDFEGEFLKSLKTEIVINDSDPAEIRAMKERVKAARQEMLEMLEQGMSAEEVLKKVEQQREDDAAVRMEAVNMIRQMLDEGDREGAEELCRRYNEALEKMGIMTIQLPGRRERKDSKQ